jgi:hypothetical protein
VFALETVFQVTQTEAYLAERRGIDFEILEIGLQENSNLTN